MKEKMRERCEVVERRERMEAGEEGIEEMILDGGIYSCRETWDDADHDLVWAQGIFSA